MNILNVLYTITISPIKLILEIIFSSIYRISHSAGLSILCLSLVMNILLLPIYNKTDKIQENEGKIQKKLKPGVDHIKKSFKGDEQYMILQTYYRQNNYKPIYSLKGMISLVIEIPFFIAAYSYLKDLSVLNESSFFFIRDLGMPDGILNGINILPILMTTVNIISCIFYTKNSKFRDNVQLYIIALVFLVLLYDAPSSLSFYYLCNNLFSLCKNIVQKYNIKPKKRHVSFLVCVFGLIGLIFINVKKLSSETKQLAFNIIFILMIIQYLFYIIKKKSNYELKIENSKIVKLFILSTIVMCVLTGLFIPSQVIKSSPSEFIDSVTLRNPMEYILNTFFLSFGFFVVWLNVIFVFVNRKTKKVLCIFMWIFIGMSITNYFFFGTNLGTLNSFLQYENSIDFSNAEYFINIMVLLLVSFIMIYILIKRNSFTNLMCAVLIIALFLSSIINIRTISNSLTETYETLNRNRYDLDYSIPLSSTKNNIIVIVIDRAIGRFFDYALEEKPQLKDKFAGFTYYPNTYSYGHNTSTAIDAIYGGYDYIPIENNKRTSETIVNKHNEALKVLPTIFSSNGYITSVINPPLSNYSYKYYDLSIYQDNKKINAYTTINKYKVDGIDYSNFDLSILNRNLFCFSIMKCSPLIMNTIIYNRSNYLGLETKDQYIVDFNHAFGYYKDFLDGYADLLNLDNLFNVSNTSDTFTILYNDTPHSSTLLQLPNYTPSYHINNDKYENGDAIVRTSCEGKEMILDTEVLLRHYHSFMATILKLADFIDYLKTVNVYDNTKIIICSDHGKNVGLEEYILDDGLDALAYNPILLVKDFNSITDNVEFDNTYMTNADVPYLALEGIIRNPTNPFTQKPITSDYKTQNNHIVINDGQFSEFDSVMNGEFVKLNTNLFKIGN